MANISYGGHSFIIDGQHTWLACGSVDYARVPYALWRERVRAVRQAGLNCVQTSVYWDLHEPQPGTFRFEGQTDLRRFLQVLEEEGLWCLLRPGPFVDGGWDLGGIPPWLLERTRQEEEPVRLRQGSPRFLQAVARYIDAVMSQVRDLQVTEPQGGPLILIQCEHEWFSQNDQEAEGYLQQINRFLRESGCAVPLINTNNLFQQVPGTIDGWDGDGDIFANCRQLRVLQPDAPCFVTSLPAGGPDTWGHGREEPQPAEQLLRRMVQVSAAGGMFNLEPFCGGTNFGFHGGRLGGADDLYVTTSHDAHAPLSETGGRRAKYEQVKRFSTFLTQFGSLMANLNAQEHHAVAATGLSVIQQSGSLGDAVFILNDDPEREEPVELITPDGQSLPIELNGDAVAWVVRDANLGGVATLNVTNLRPWAFLGRQLLVLFGPAGSEALLSIDGTLLSGQVPKGNTPLVMQQDNITVAVMNSKQVDAAYPDGDEGLYVGIGGLDEQGQPLPHKAFGSFSHVALDGTTTRHRHSRSSPPTAPSLGSWERAGLDPYLKGTAPRYATIEGPRSLEACGADFGYGWYRLRVKRSRSKKVNLFVPHSGDRLHLYVNGKFSRILGHGPSAAAEPMEFNFPSGETELVFLADNLGRFSEGLGLEQPKGLCGPLLDLKTVRLSKPERSVQPRINPFELTGYVPRAAADDRSPYPRYTFNVSLQSKSELVLLLSGDRPRSVILVNDEPVAIDVGEGVTASYRLNEHVVKGKNRITLALIDPVDEGDTEGTQYDPRDNAALYRVAEDLSAEADWWYARWQIPDDEAFRPMPGSTPSTPAFYRTTFEVSRTDWPLLLRVDGPSKGQLYLNGHNVGRYFVATHTGKKVAPQRRYYLPGPWLSTEEPNELVLFEEHGKSPSRCSLEYDAFGPFGEEEEE